MSAKDRLLNVGYREVLLPSGIRVRGVMPQLMDLVRRRMIPTDLMAKLISAEQAVRENRELTPEEFDARVSDQYIEAAAFIRQIQAEDGTWENVTITPVEIRDGGMDPRDREALLAIATNTSTPEIVTAESEVALGIRPAAEAEAIKEREAGGTVEAWSEFRDDGRGEAPGGDGEGVGTPAKPADRSERRRRARARSSSRPQDRTGEDRSEGDQGA